MLTRLYITVEVYKPGIIAETVFSSITSSQLSFICLQPEQEQEQEHYPTDEEVDYPAWAVVENNLCRLTKLFSAGNPGKIMEVVVSESLYLDESQTSDLLENHIWEKVFSKLMKEATASFRFVIRSSTVILSHINLHGRSDVEETLD